MKHFFAAILGEWKHVIMPALVKLGFVGAGVIGFADSAAIPVPVDAILALYVWEDKAHFWMYILLAAAGSALGGLVPYWIGRGGGEIYLHRHVNHQKFDKLRQKFENKEFAAVLIPSMLPPPTPWKIFVFAAGVFEMPVRSFLLAVFLGRVIRWLALALLVLELGPGAVSMVQHHALLVLAVAGGLVLLAVGWWWMRMRRRKKREKRIETA